MHKKINPVSLFRLFNMFFLNINFSDALEIANLIFAGSLKETKGVLFNSGSAWKGNTS